MSGPCKDSSPGSKGVTTKKNSLPPSLSESTMEPHKATVVQGTGHREEWGNQDAKKKPSSPVLPCHRIQTKAWRESRTGKHSDVSLQCVTPIIATIRREANIAQSQSLPAESCTAPMWHQACPSPSTHGSSWLYCSATCFCRTHRTHVYSGFKEDGAWCQRRRCRKELGKGWG